MLHTVHLGETMAPSTGLLFLQFNSILNPSQLSKVISSAVRKVDKSLYIFVKDVPAAMSVSNLNSVVNQLYETSTKSALSDVFDSRVMLPDLRDSISGNNKSLKELNTHLPVDILLALPTVNVSPVTLTNKRETTRLEPLNVDLPQEETFHGSSHKRPSLPDIPNLADQNKTYPHVVMGGTFDRLHVGHKILLSAAILRSEKSLTIGVTDGKMIRTKKLWELIEPCETRIRKLREFLQDIEPRLEYRIVPIEDPYGPTAYDPDLQVLFSNIFIERFDSYFSIS